MQIRDENERAPGNERAVARRVLRMISQGCGPREIRRDTPNEGPGRGRSDPPPLPSANKRKKNKVKARSRSCTEMVPDAHGEEGAGCRSCNRHAR